MDIFTILLILIFNLLTAILAFFLKLQNDKKKELSGDKPRDMKRPLSHENTNKTRDGNTSTSGNFPKKTDIANRSCKNSCKSTCMASGKLTNATKMADKSSDSDLQTTDMTHKSSESCQPNATDIKDKSPKGCPSKTTDMSVMSFERCPSKTTNPTDGSSEICPSKSTDDKSSERCHQKVAVPTDKYSEIFSPKATDMTEMSSERCPSIERDMTDSLSERCPPTTTDITDRSSEGCPSKTTNMTEMPSESCSQSTHMPKYNEKVERDKSMPTGRRVRKKTKHKYKEKVERDKSMPTGRRVRKKTKAKKGKNKRAKRIESSESTLVIKPKGLPNIGMTCFMNSVLQCLMWTPGMKQQLKLQVQKSDNNGSRKDIARCLLDLINDVQSGTVTPKSVKKLLIAVRKRNSQFSGYDQQDSYEMFNAIVSGMEDEILNQKKDDENTDSKDMTNTERIMNICPVTRLFGGMYVTVYAYSSCDHIEIDFQRFTSICVPVPCETLPDETNTKNRHKESVLSTDVYSLLDYEDVLITPNNDKTYWGADESEFYFPDFQNLINAIEYEKYIRARRKDKEKYQSENYQMEPRTEINQMCQYSQNEFSKTEENCSAITKRKRKKPEEMTGTKAKVTDQILQISNNEHEKEDLGKVRNIESTVERDRNLKRKWVGNDDLIRPPKKKIQKSETCNVINEDENEIGGLTIKTDDDINIRTTNCKNPHNSSKNIHQRKEKVEKTFFTRRRSADGQCNGFNNMDTSTNAGSTSTVMNTKETSSQETDPMEVDIPEVSSHDTNEQTKQGHGPISELYPENRKEVSEDEVYIEDHIDHTNSISKPNSDAHFETITNNACGMNKLQKGLHELTTIEEFSENDLPCGTCNNLESSGRCYKKLMIMLPPPVLVLQINRFQPSRFNGQLEKIQSDVSYPENLDLSPFVSSAYKLLNNKAGTTAYSLYGVVCHSGSIRGGHYYAYIKTSRNNTDNLHRHFLEEKWSDPERLKDKILDFWRTDNVTDNLVGSMSGACTKQDSVDMSTESINGTVKGLSSRVNNGETNVLKQKTEVEHTGKHGTTQNQNKEGGTYLTKEGSLLSDTRARWYYISDSMVLAEKKQINALQDKSAYILMYKLVSNEDS